MVSRLKDKGSGLGQHAWPVGLFVGPWIMGQDFLQKCKVVEAFVLFPGAVLVRSERSVSFLLVLLSCL